MILTPSELSRRRFLRGATATCAALYAPGVFAELLTRTPAQTEGPFYPDRMPLDTDNDLLILNDSITPAVGEVTHLTGKILDANGEPIRNALVEIWQTDDNGIYRHTRDRDQDERDPHFQSYGRFSTDREGKYYFRTIKPQPYPGRTPHIHYKVSKGEDHLLTTQCYVRGHELNARDGVLRSIRDDAQRESVLVNFAPIEDSDTGELAANFDVVVGWTPPDEHEH
ncbi:protocatechuate 3,4-dioxygenase [Phycisphaeraceae bacterium D3-23]